MLNLDKLTYAGNLESLTSIATDTRYKFVQADIVDRWVPEDTFESGLRKTVEWYLDNLEWCQQVQDGSYQGERLGFTDFKDLIA
ncbi:hypothetical protein PMI22_04850 [Pseudomonas sp. GM21]|nr:hypothetical protein PMI22_04850 [Pseudomonas sp. GM21]